jgi:hypothetical protein
MGSDDFDYIYIYLYVLYMPGLDFQILEKTALDFCKSSVSAIFCALVPETSLISLTFG